MSEFKVFKDAVNAQFDKMTNHHLFTSEVSKDELWDTYLGSFPEGTNPIFRERTEHDCSCCKQFIRDSGNVVTVFNNKKISIWDIDIGGTYQVVADALAKLVKSKPIKDVFYHYENNIGTDHNHEKLETGKILTWNHFHYKLPQRLVLSKANIATKLSDLRSNKEVFKRGLVEFTFNSVDTILELIEQNSLYRGSEKKTVLKKFIKHMKDFDELKTEEAKDNYAWANSIEMGGASKLRNTSLGTLIIDVSEDMDLDKAVRKYEEIVAPDNYQRPKPVISKAQVKKLEDRIYSLGLMPSLPRRYAVKEDITINNVIFANRDVKKSMNVFDEMGKDVKSNVKHFDKVEEVTIDNFVKNILPKADSIELMFENKHINNLVSLISPVNADSKHMFKWDNNFSWTYNGEVADSLKDQVAKLGGRVDGVLRFSHTWNKDGKNQSLMDLHVFMPNCNYTGKGTIGNGTSDRYPTGGRVGWNNRTDRKSGGNQDVDFVKPPNKSVPVENITFPHMHKLPEGDYVFKIHNWNLRKTTTSGFDAEIECNGEIYQYHYPNAVKHKEWITVATATLKDGVFTMNHVLKPATASQELWNVDTNNFHKVSMIMKSPNHWDGNNTGNKHWFFMMDDCKQGGEARGFYNEFLMPELHSERKAFEVLGSKMKVEPSDDQLSGLGFSSTQHSQVVCKVSGSFARTIKINF